MEDNGAVITRIYNLARLKGLCNTKAEFSKLTGLNRATTSMAMSGDPKYATDNLVKRLHIWAVSQGLEEDETLPAPNVAQQAPAQDGVFIPRETQRMFDNMAETIRLQAQMLSQAQFTIGMPSTAAQKNVHHNEDRH